MPKKTQDPDVTDSRTMQGGRAPPPLSEEMIAKLQAAVDAAQRKRGQRLNPPKDPKHGD